MDFKDIAGLSGPLTKLVEIVAQGFSRVTKGYFTKRDAEATAFAIKTISDSKSTKTRTPGWKNRYMKKMV